MMSPLFRIRRTLSVSLGILPKCLARHDVATSYEGILRTRT